MKHPECSTDWPHARHRFYATRLRNEEECDGEVEWSPPGVPTYVMVRECDSDTCHRPAAAEWRALIDPRYSLVSGTMGRFLLCEDHDEFYKTHEREHHAKRVRSIL